MLDILLCFRAAVFDSNLSCNRLVLATTFSSRAVPSSIAAYVNVVEFSQSRDGLEEMFLDRFLRLEKPRMQDTRTQVVDVSIIIVIVKQTQTISYIFLFKNL